MDDLYVPDPALVRLAFGALVAWFVLLGLLRVVRSPRRPRPGPETTELGTEPPALVNLVTNRFKLTADAVPATLVDLAARGVIEIEDRGLGDFYCRLKERPRGLTPYEQMLLDHLQRVAVDGVVPAEALTTGPQDVSRAWWGEFRNRVVVHARGAGFARNLWSAATIGILFAAGAVVALLYFWALGFHDPDGVAQATLLDVVSVGGGAAVATLLVTAVSQRQTDTEAGRRAAARWLGVREAMEGSPSFGVVPPTGVIVWERHLAYAAALGVAPRAIRSLPMGAESDTEAWTARAGGWQKVAVRYPRWRPGWGRHPGLALLVGGFGSYVGYNMLRLGVEDMGFSGWTSVAAAVAASLGAVVFVRSTFQLLAALADLLVYKKKVSGKILRARTRWGPVPYMTQSDDRQYVRCFIAIEDGRSETLTAYRVRTKIYDEVRQGAEVELEVTPRLGYVSRVTRRPG